MSRIASNHARAGSHKNQSQRPEPDPEAEFAALDLLRDFLDHAYLHFAGLAGPGCAVALDAGLGLPSDDRFDDQFYLLNSTAGELDLHLFSDPITGAGVWDEFTGAGVKVAVIDDGIDKLHHDLDGNYDASLETVDGSHPIASDRHGTAVSGIIAAERDDIGTVGIAYDASITSMAAISDAPNITLEESLLNAVNFDVVNNSWGFTFPMADQFFNPGFANFYQAYDALSADGRDGLGTIFVKSAGNGRASDDNTAFSSLNASYASVTVAAVDRGGNVTDFSTEGAALLVSAFGGRDQVTTTDRIGAAGYSADDYTATFSGTSAAAPMVSGVVALMLDANPNLGFRDVSEILAVSARHTGSAIGDAPAGWEHYAWDWNASEHWNGRGLHFSEDYGFGLVDALAAVRLAESWTAQSTLANLQVVEAATSDLATPITFDHDDGAFSITFGVETGLRLESVRVDLGLAHTYTGDLLISLASPSGTVSELLHGNGRFVDIPNYGTFDISLGSNAFRGEVSAGTWTLLVSDSADSDSGTLSAALLTLYGSASVDDIHVLTNEASLYMTPGDVIGDANGGTDTLNASALSGASFLDLSGHFGSSADGVSFTVLDTIENLVGGDGGDTLIGSSGENWLRGYRGDDLLDGRSGDDWLDGGAGNDVLNGGSGVDVAVYGGARAAYNVSKSGSAYKVTGGSDGGDTLFDIEWLQFSDAQMRLGKAHGFDGNGPGKGHGPGHSQGYGPGHGQDQGHGHDNGHGHADTIAGVEHADWVLA